MNIATAGGEQSYPYPSNNESNESEKPRRRKSNKRTSDELKTHEGEESLEDEESRNDSDESKEDEGNIGVGPRELQIKEADPREPIIKGRKSIRPAPSRLPEKGKNLRGTTPLNQNIVALAITIVVCLIAVCSWYIFSTHLNIFSTHLNIFSTQLNTNSFLDEMKKRFPSQPLKDLKIFVYQVERSVNSSRPVDRTTVTTILHHEEHGRSKAFGEVMAQYAASMLKKGGGFHLNGEDITGDYNPCDRSCIKSKIVEKGTLLVYNFDKIPSSVVIDFHSICDKFTPFVNDRTVYILVLNIPKPENISDLEKFRKHLKDHTRLSMKAFWSDLNVEYLEPLITRLTENLIWIFPSDQ